MSNGKKILENADVKACGIKALCVGINNYKNYPGSALQGCVNDTKDMENILKKYLGFCAPDIVTLVDAQATKENIMNNLKDMVNGAKAGKYSYLVFSLSSHGTQVPDTSAGTSRIEQMRLFARTT